MLFNFIKCMRRKKKKPCEHEYSYAGGRSIYDKIEYLFVCKKCNEDKWIPRTDITDIFDQGKALTQHVIKDISKEKLIKEAKELTINYYRVMGINITEIEGGFDNLITDYCLYLEEKENPTYTDFVICPKCSSGHLIINEDLSPIEHIKCECGGVIHWTRGSEFHMLEDGMDFITCTIKTYYEIKEDVKMAGKFVVFDNNMKKVGETDSQNDACREALGANGCVGVRTEGSFRFKEILYEAKMKEVLCLL